ncbi:MAG TPA: sugar ABC transporter ATP-binding protein [Candidatus Baltobacterales bacterium]|nr:sugar ABC transporter ATP-binding protein [Candidatus Baltobacterales bacterium]
MALAGGLIDPAARQVVELDHVTKRFGGVRAVNDVSFTLAAGEVVALAGENGAGKSTIKNLLAGIVKADSGTITICGDEIVGDPRHARRLGVAAIHQELSLFPTMSVAENVLMASLSSDVRGVVRSSSLKRRVGPLLERLGADFSSGTTVESLGPGERQLVEIAKALALAPSVIIFDEPTASLNERERERIYEIVRQLAADRVAVLYISHHLSEIFELSDRVVVLRDGNLVALSRTTELTRGKLESLMVGRELAGEMPRAAEPSDEGALRVRDLDDGSLITGVSFEIRRGEIFGLAGLMGAGRSEVARAIFGVSRATGTIEIGGRSFRRMTPKRAIEAGMAFVTEDRRGDGLFIDRPIRENLSVVALDDVTAPWLGWVHRRLETETAQRKTSLLRIAARSGLEAPARSLSGGNQQKVVLGKWLWRDPSVLIMDEPTRGIDVGAKAEIHQLLVDFAERGVAVLLISSELPELLGLAHRIGVMHAGRLVGILDRSEASPDKIIRLATGGGL